jgi:hypothetical protein
MWYLMWLAVFVLPAGYFTHSYLFRRERLTVTTWAASGFWVAATAFGGGLYTKSRCCITYLDSTPIQYAVGFLAIVSLVAATLTVFGKYPPEEVTVDV